MTNIAVQDGKILLRDGAIGTEQSCCCKKCEGPCDAENACPEGCECVNGRCVTECSGPCDAENPCPEGCRCFDGECVPECSGPCDGDDSCPEGCECVGGECSGDVPPLASNCRDCCPDWFDNGPPEEIELTYSVSTDGAVCHGALWLSPTNNLFANTKLLPVSISGTGTMQRDSSILPSSRCYSWGFRSCEIDGLTFKGFFALLQLLVFNNRCRWLFEWTVLNVVDFEDLVAQTGIPYNNIGNCACDLVTDPVTLNVTCTTGWLFRRGTSDLGTYSVNTVPCLLPTFSRSTSLNDGWPAFCAPTNRICSGDGTFDGSGCPTYTLSESFSFA
jgi:hypothetical protein